MSAHFDGGAEIAGRRLREVEVTYVDDPTLDMGAEDSDDCPASPPPTYYLRVREENKGRRSSGDGDVGVQGGGHDGALKKHQDNGPAPSDNASRKPSGKKKKKDKAWAWRYVNVENKSLLVWDRRGGRLLRSIPLKDVESLQVLPDQDSPASILEISIASPGPFSIGDGDGDTDGDAPTEGAPDNGCGSNADLLVLQARSRRETLLWAKVLQENVELMTKRHVPLENLDVETNLSDVQQLAKLLTHQLSELQHCEQNDQQQSFSNASRNQRNTSVGGVNEPIPEGSEDETEDL